MRKLLNAHAWCWNQPLGLVWCIHSSSVRQEIRGADGDQLPEREREMEVLEPEGQNNENEKIKVPDSKPCGPVGC